MNRFLMIKSIQRVAFDGSDETLEFSPGVNLIVGKPNTGKTKWLSMIDYLMGDKDQPEKTFGDLAEKYDSIRALFSVSGEDFWVERNWKKPGYKSKVIVEGDAISCEEFSQFLLERLKIPIIHFPKGNPYEERNWPELSWRTLLRHIYRQQRFWGDIADKQLPGEQHACLLQFMGIAQYLYSEKSGILVQKRKNIWKLEGKKEQYISILDEITKEITEEQEFQAGITFDSVDYAITRLKQKLLDLQNRRKTILVEISTTAQHQSDGNLSIHDLQENWSRLSAEKESLLGKEQFGNKRLVELTEYKLALDKELSKIERTKIAGSLLLPLKVTHCPVCDQPLQHSSNDEKHCYLCGQPQEKQIDDGIARLDAEKSRVREEINEVQKLIFDISKEKNQYSKRIRIVSNEMGALESQIRPLQQAASLILPSELSILDMEMGRYQEKIRQLETIKSILQNQSLISKQIDQLRSEILQLEAEVKLENSKIHYELSANTLVDNMGDYLNKLNSPDRLLWSQGRVKLRLREKDFEFRIDDNSWSTKLGGTLTIYFLLSYHFGLLKLSKNEVHHYPGFLLVDLPAKLDDGSQIKDNENFIVQPFVDLLSQPGMENAQAIFTGAAFENLEGVNRIDLTKVWK